MIADRVVGIRYIDATGWWGAAEEMKPEECLNGQDKADWKRSEEGEGKHTSRANREE